jgi:hypothetical protein
MVKTHKLKQRIIKYWCALKQLLLSVWVTLRKSNPFNFEFEKTRK